jgi:hypothetical protein
MAWLKSFSVGRNARSHRIPLGLGLSQGVGNGLCGVMVWANVVDIFTGGALRNDETQLESLLEYVGEAMEQRFASATGDLRLGYANAYTGLEFAHIVAAGEIVADYTRQNFGFGLKLDLPFADKKPASFPHFWNTLRDGVLGPERIAIIGLKNYYHYTVITELFDDVEDPGNSLAMVRDSYDLIGIRRRDMGLASARMPMNVDAEETIIITRLSGSVS